MFERLRKWAVLALVVLALVFSVGFLLGRASVPYPIGAAVSRVPETNTENEKQDAEENEAADSAAAETDGADQAALQGIVNINTADADTLQTLPGVGEVLAGRIIEYRELSGGFVTVEQLMEVSGIGQQKFDALRDDITVEDTP